MLPRSHQRFLATLAVADGSSKMPRNDEGMDVADGDNMQMS